MLKRRRRPLPNRINDRKRIRAPRCDRPNIEIGGPGVRQTRTDCLGKRMPCDPLISLAIFPPSTEREKVFLCFNLVLGSAVGEQLLSWGTDFSPRRRTVSWGTDSPRSRGSQTSVPLASWTAQSQRVARRNVKKCSAPWGTDCRPRSRGAQTSVPTASWTAQSQRVVEHRLQPSQSHRVAGHRQPPQSWVTDFSPRSFLDGAVAARSETQCQKVVRARDCLRILAPGPKLGRN